MHRIHDMRDFDPVRTLSSSSSTSPVRGGALGLVLLDFIPRIVGAGAMRVIPVVDFAHVNPDDEAMDVADFRIPVHMIADLEFQGFDAHCSRKLNNALAREQILSTVKPYSRSRTSPGADAPKRFTLTPAP